jgi:hypothetical protein
MTANESWRDLALADRHIARALANLERQESIVNSLAGRGRVTAEVSHALETMRSVLVAMCWHRERIARHAERQRHVRLSAGVVLTAWEAQDTRP